MTMYLTGCSNKIVKDAGRQDIGLLIQPGNGYHRQLDAYPAWAADNGAYKRGARYRDFNFSAWWSWITERVAPAHQAARSDCLFVTAPDAIDVSEDGREVVGHALATIQRGLVWLPKLRALGLPTAFVAQNGMETMLDALPWDLMDVLFVGGSTEWKLGQGAAAVIREAQRRGKKIHMGRVNSGRRFAYCRALGIDTADGTFLGFGPAKNFPQLTRWLDAA